MDLFLASILCSIYDIAMHDFMWTSWLIPWNGCQVGTISSVSFKIINFEAC